MKAGPISAGYRAGQAAVLVDIAQHEVHAHLQTNESPLKGTRIEHLFPVGGSQIIVDAKLDYQNVSDSAFYAQSGSAFVTEVDFDRGITLHGERSYFGQSVSFSGTVGWNGDIRLSGTTSRSTSFNLGIARVSVGQAFTASISGNINSGNLNFHADVAWWFSGTKKVWFTKWGLSGTAGLSVDVGFNNLNTFDIGSIDAMASGRLRFYYGFGSASISAGIGIHIGDSVRVDLGGLGSVSF
ncbi:MAG: hypothetical protein R3C49_04800 [Planctomycetaceae bacterium]